MTLQPQRWHAPGLSSMLTVCALIIHGYHPYVEDGGVYIAGIRKLLDPTLYPAFTEFVTEHLRFSLFAPIVATLAGLSHLSLENILFFLYLLSLWLTLYSGWMLVRRLTSSIPGRLGAVILLTCWLTLPIAGTSLTLVDPYVTARSFSTPLILMALAWSFDCKATSWFLAALALILAAALHPLMAGYGMAAVILIACTTSYNNGVRRLGIPILAILAITLAAILQLHAPAESSAYKQIVATRAYWFPLAWAWYEQVGLIAPFIILYLLRRSRGEHSSQWCQAINAALALGAIAVLVAALFSHQSFAAHLIARLQPLRSLQVVYEIMILTLGAWAGDKLHELLKAHSPRHHTSLMLAAFLPLAVISFLGQRNTFPNSTHIEFPWAHPSNSWEQAFLWIRDNTPKAALFALDARYITLGRHEDAQCFRAIAQRSALPDYSKDGGEASITPGLTSAWTLGQAAQSGLETAPDPVRIGRLQPLGVSWLVLEADSPTTFNCPYRNHTVKVCRLPSS